MTLQNNKSLGQHWLKNRAILDEIADLTVCSDCPRLCIEIGPGLGTLTSSLLRRFEKVIAIEFDEKLAGNLPNSFPGKNLEVVNSDVLAVDFAALASGEPYVVAGNIPYYITSPIIRHLLSQSHLARNIALLVQKEVAERVAAEPGDHTLLSLTTQNLAEVSLGPVVRAEEFTPPPKVDSRVLILEPRPEPVIDPACLELAKTGFSSPRKKLVHNLASLPGCSREFWLEQLSRLSINPSARAEDLELLDWQSLYASTREES